MLLWHGSRLTNWTGILSQGSLIFILALYFISTQMDNRSDSKLFEQGCELLLLKLQQQATCLGKLFTLQICSQKVQTTAMLAELPDLVLFSFVRLTISETFSSTRI